MATEKTRLLGKYSFNYRSNASLTLDPKSNECIVVVPSCETNCEADRDRSFGLTLEELSPFLDDPWWKLLRRYAFASCWILLIAIFAAACIISMAELKQQRCKIINSTKVPPLGTVVGNSAIFVSMLKNVPLSPKNVMANAATALIIDTNPAYSV